MVDTLISNCTTLSEYHDISRCIRPQHDDIKCNSFQAVYLVYGMRLVNGTTIRFGRLNELRFGGLGVTRFGWVCVCVCVRWCHQVSC